MGRTLRLFVIAGEASGDRLGAGLIAALRGRVGRLDLEGVGGSCLAAEGLASLFDLNDLAVMGIAEVLPRYPKLRHRLYQTVRAALRFRPDILITIDSPDFTLAAAHAIRRRGSRHLAVHYVAPSVWAWRPSRSRLLPGRTDLLLALLPFEPCHFEPAGIECEFVGHPAAALPKPSDSDIASFRDLHKIGDRTTLVVLPGSRPHEIARLAPVFRSALDRLSYQVSDLAIVLPVAPGQFDLVAAQTAGWPIPPILLPPHGTSGEPRLRQSAYASAAAALAASGSVTLELAAAGTPTVVAYDMNRFTWGVISSLARVNTVTLVNLVSGRNVVPEALGPACTPDRITRKLTEVLTDGRLRDAQRQAFDLALDRLGRNGPHPYDRAADAIVARLGHGR